MGDLIVPENNLPSRRVCGYCGTPLKAHLYFCDQCATPYKSEEKVLPRLPPPVLTDDQLIKAKAPRVPVLFFTYLGVLVFVGVVSAIFFQRDRPELSYFFGIAAIFGVTCVVGALDFTTLRPQLGNGGFLTSGAWVGLLILVPLLLLNFAYHSVIYKLAEHAGTDPMAQLREKTDELTLIVGFCVLPAITEELAFRGLIQHWLENAFPARKALIIASGLFAALHFSVLSAPYLFLVGVLLGWVKMRTKSLYPSMLIHFLHNFVAIEFINFHGK